MRKFITYEADYERRKHFMKRTATILLWVTIVFEILYSLIGSVITVYNVFFNEEVYGLEMPEIIYVISRSALQIWVPASLVAVGAVVMLILMATKSKNIIPEVIALVLYSGLGSILLIPMEVISHIVDEEYWVAYFTSDVSMYIQSGLNYAAIFYYVPMILLPVAIAFLIAYKKYVKA